MAEKQETVADIIAEKRREANYIVQVSQGKCQTRRDKAEDEARDIRREADRLEAALRREVDKLNSAIQATVGRSDAEIDRLRREVAELKRVGNAAKLREALCEILSYIESFHKYIIPGKREKTTAIFAVADTIRGKARAALAAPARNCDTGTAEEQFERWQAFCNRYDPDCKGCPCDGPECSFACCFAKWAQMPYEEGGAK